MTITEANGKLFDLEDVAAVIQEARSATFESVLAEAAELRRKRLTRMKAHDEQIRAETREACAKIVERMCPSCHGIGFRKNCGTPYARHCDHAGIPAAIRAGSGTALGACTCAVSIPGSTQFGNAAHGLLCPARGGGQ